MDVENFGFVLYDLGPQLSPSKSSVVFCKRLPFRESSFIVFLGGSESKQFNTCTTVVEIMVLWLQGERERERECVC